MPEFNKGDFTQQGVAGHVNANLRLNEKRLVSIDLTSNEEAEGCTITGTVKDLLNDKVYGVGSGVSGNIEITENGENINVAPYATATVNVAGGGGLNLATMEVTLNNEGASSVTAQILHIQDGYLRNGLEITNMTTSTVTVPITKMDPPLPVAPVLYVATLGNVSLTNNNTLNNCTLNVRPDGDVDILVTDPEQLASAIIGVTAGGQSQRGVDYGNIR